MLRRYIIPAGILIGLVMTLSARADSIVLKKGGYEVKGFIVDNFYDRVLINTSKGEQEVKKDNIDKIEFDDNDRGYVYKAQNILFDGELSEAALDRAEDFFEDARRLNSRNQEAEWGLGRVKDERLKLKNTQLGFLGLTLSLEGNMIKILEVTPRSPAGEAGIKVGDILVSVWDRKIKYEEVPAVIRLLSGPPDSQLILALEREVSLGYNSKAAHNLRQVLTISERGIFPKPNIIPDILPSDKVVAICGDNARYISDEYLSWFVENFRDKNIIITIRRVISLKRGSF